MTIDEIFSQIVAHMKKGLDFHEQLITIYRFLNLYGYAKCQEYHYYEENLNYQLLQDYYLQYYQKLIPVIELEKMNIIPSNWYKYTGEDVDTNTRRTAIQTLMKEWIKWETETKILLQNSYKRLCELNDNCAAEEIIKFLKAVDKELKNAREKYINLESINYDIVSITEEQKAYYKKYSKKIYLLYKDKVVK